MEKNEIEMNDDEISGFKKHVRCEGTRFHVISWDSNGRHCSEKNCIINKK